MIEWISDWWALLTWSDILIAAGLFLLSLVISLAALTVVAVKIPQNYFSSHYRKDFMAGSSWLVRWGATIGKNVLGILLIVFGVVLSLPGIPGQGFLTILIGLIMVDIPGKRPLECHIVKWPKVLSTLNALRKKFDKKPLQVD
jgi:hypothetical protein